MLPNSKVVVAYRDLQPLSVSLITHGNPPPRRRRSGRSLCCLLSQECQSTHRLVLYFQCTFWSCHSPSHWGTRLRRHVSLVDPASVLIWQSYHNFTYLLRPLPHYLFPLILLYGETLGLHNLLASNAYNHFLLPCWLKVSFLAFDHPFLAFGLPSQTQ